MGFGGKGGSQTITTYFINCDFLLGFGAMQRVGSCWRDNQGFGIGTGSQTFPGLAIPANGSSTISITNTPGGSSYFACIIGAFLTIPFSVTFGDYAGPQGGGNTGLQSGNINQFLYNIPVGYFGNNYAPQGSSSFMGPPWPYISFDCNTRFYPSASPAFTIHAGASAISGGSLTVYYYYASSTYNGGPNFSFNQPTWPVNWEGQLGSGSEYSFPGGSAQQIIYPEFSGVGFTSLSLGQANVIPQFNFEADGLFGYTNHGDANVADVILDIICSGPSGPQRSSAVTGGVWNHGIGLPNNFVVDPPGYAAAVPANPSWPQPTTFSRGLMGVRTYCEATGIFVSSVLDTQRTFNDWLTDLFDIGNAAPYFNGQQLVVYPRCEVSQVGGNGIYWSPTASGPVFDFNDSNMIAKEDEPPLTCERKRNTDIYNIHVVEHLNRSLGYQTVMAVYANQAHVYLNGPNKNFPRQLHWLNDPTSAVKVASVFAKRATEVENQNYKWAASPIWILLDPFDLVTVNDAAMGLTSFPVRITSMIESNEQIDFEAEPFVYGASNPTDLNKNTPGGYGNGQYNDPGQPNTPFIFEPMPRLAAFATTPEIWFAVSGPSIDWGGCDIYMSTDGGTSYQFQARQMGSSTLGVTYNSTFPSHADPDAVDSLWVDLTQSAHGNTLSSFTTAQRDSFVPLMIVAPGGSVTINGKTYTAQYEIVSVATTALQSTGKYLVNGVTTAIRRGVFNTTPVSHAVGQQLCFIGPGGGAITKLNIDPSLVGKTLWFKFTSFNTFGNMEYSLAQATAYSFTPTGLTGTGSGNGSYTISPTTVLYQGRTGGWAGVDANSSTWTDPTKIYIPPFTVTWTNPPNTASYLARDSGVAAFTVTTGGETAYVSVYDPGQTGETSSLDPTFADIGSNAHNAPGYIQLGSITSASWTGGGSGGGTGGGGGSSNPGPWDLTINIPVNLAAIPNPEIFRARVAHVMSFPANFTGSYSDARITSTGTVVFTVKQSGSTVGTVTFSAGSSTATFATSSPSGFTMNPGDEFSITVTSGAGDATLAAFSFTFTCTRS